MFFNNAELHPKVFEWLGVVWCMFPLINAVQECQSVSMDQYSPYSVLLVTGWILTCSRRRIATVCRISPPWKTSPFGRRVGANEFIAAIVAKVSSDASMSAHPDFHRIHIGLIGNQEVAHLEHKIFATQTRSGLWTGREFPHHLWLCWKLKNCSVTG